MLSTAIVVLVGGIFAAMAILVSTYEIRMHFEHYTNPVFQLHIVRILGMVPIYSVTAWGALVATDATITLVLDVLRDCYEAFVIYNFVVLLIAYAGGDRQLSYYLEGRQRLPHIWPLNLWLPPLALGPTFVNFTRASCVQFVFVKPSISLFMLYAHFRGLFGLKGAVKIFSGLVNNVSISVALYGLVLFYHGTHELLKPYNPLPKFLAVKAVVFFSFWQGVALKCLTSIGLLKDIGDATAGEVATGLQDILICFEMFVAACVHHFVFSYKEYQVGLRDRADHDAEIATMPLLRKVGDVIDVRDVLSDAKDRLAGGTKYESELRDSEPLISARHGRLSFQESVKMKDMEWSARGPMFLDSQPISGDKVGNK